MSIPKLDGNIIYINNGVLLISQDYPIDISDFNFNDFLKCSSFYYTLMKEV